MIVIFLTLRVVLGVKEFFLDGLEKYLKKGLMAGETPTLPRVLSC